VRLVDQPDRVGYASLCITVHWLRSPGSVASPRKRLLCSQITIGSREGQFAKVFNSAFTPKRGLACQLPRKAGGWLMRRRLSVAAVAGGPRAWP
jgi:hypothetical protein